MNIRDIATILGFPRLRHMVQNARRAGLETLLDYQRLALLAAAADHCRNLEGDVIEFGSYKGGSAGLIGQALTGTNKTLHVCDSFEGLPAPTSHDNYVREGDFCDTTAAQVKDGLRLLSVRAQLHVGFFAETLPRLSDLRFALAHVDVDLYESVRTCLQFCYPRMVARGIIIIDDYTAPTCLGAKKAVDEFFETRAELPVLLSKPACGVRVGSNDITLFHALRRRAGCISALPFIGAALYRR